MSIPGSYQMFCYYLLLLSCIEITGNTFTLAKLCYSYTLQIHKSQF